VKRGKHFENAEYANSNNQYRQVYLMLISALSLLHLVFYSQSYCHKHCLPPFQDKNPKVRTGSAQQSEFYHRFARSISQAQDLEIPQPLQKPAGSQLPEYALYSLKVPCVPCCPTEHWQQ